jgi:nitroreductase
LEFQKVIQKRKTVRAFEPRPIPKDIVDRILNNAQRGPSSGYSQGFDFLVFDGREMTKTFWKHLENEESYQKKSADIEEDPVQNASLIVIPLAHSQAYVQRYLEPDKQQVGRRSAEDWPAPYWFIDTAFAAMLMLLTAVDAGLGAYYFSIGPTSKTIPVFRKAFGIPEEYFPIGAIAFGYPKETEPSPSLKRGKRPKAEVMHFGKW